MTDAILLQRMTGRTIFSLSNGYVGIRLETFYASTSWVKIMYVGMVEADHLKFVDKYREPFYLLVAQEKRDEPLRIAKHTMPHFIPLRDLEKKFLNVDMDASISITSPNMNFHNSDNCFSSHYCTYWKTMSNHLCRDESRS